MLMQKQAQLSAIWDPRQDPGAEKEHQVKATAT